MICELLQEQKSYTHTRSSMLANGSLIGLEADEWVYLFVANMNETGVPTQGRKWNEWVYLSCRRYR